MKPQDYKDDDLNEYDDELEDYIEEDEEDNNETVAAVTGWGVSILVHAVILVLLALVVVVGRFVAEEPPVKVALLDPPPPPPPVEKEMREIQPDPIEVEVEVVVTDPVVTNMEEIEIEEIQTEDPEISEVAEAKGREEAVSAAEMGGAGAFMAIGASGGASGMIGNRAGGGKKRALMRYGGTKAGEDAVDAALRWFMRHQSPNGQWDVDGYPINCDLPGPKCEPGTAHAGANGDGDAACTAYALLCYLGAGYDHRMPSKYRKVVAKGLDYLVSVQNNDGSFGTRGRNYENGVASMALAEAYAMTMDPELRDPAQLAVDNLRNLQNGNKEAYNGLGWDYKAPNNRNDSSVTGWALMALKSAEVAGLDTHGAMDGGKKWFESAWKATNPDVTDPYGRSGFPYVWMEGSNEIKKPDRTAIGITCGVFLGYGQGDLIMETMANDVMARAFDERHKSYQIQSYPMNTYYLYYNTMGIFQLGGERWRQWNDAFLPTLINSQRKDGCFSGSWDFEGTVFHGHNTGRLLSTAYVTLSLEVYYRYAQIGGVNNL